MFQPLVQIIRRAKQDRSFHFDPLLPEKAIREAFGNASELERAGTVYSLPMVVWMFLSQVLCADHSCRPTVGRPIAWLVGQGRRPCSAETATYCTAWGRLSEEGCHKLLTRTARTFDCNGDPGWLWLGRRVWVVHGTTATMPDTSANQKA